MMKRTVIFEILMVMSTSYRKELNALYDKYFMLVSYYGLTKKRIAWINTPARVTCFSILL